MAENKRIWDALRTPPPWALKPIEGGRLKGMTDISPQWRVQAMTELFGPCGIGWKWSIEELWAVPGAGGEVVAFARVNVWYREGDVWSESVPGIGGSMLIEQERNGLHTSDEAYKMAVTDALSVAMKSIGVAADVYLGMCDGKHSRRADPPPPSKQAPQSPDAPPTKGPAEIAESRREAASWAGKTGEEDRATTRISEVGVLREGTKKDGAPWTLYFVKGPDGITFETFSHTIKEAAEQAIESGAECLVHYKPNKYGKLEITTIREVPAQPAPGADIPF